MSIQTAPGTGGKPVQSTISPPTGVSTFNNLEAAATRTEALRKIQQSPVLGIMLSANPVARPPVSKIGTAPALFQVRGTDERHIETLAKGLRAGGDLEPMLVADLGSDLYVVDGHHRRAAYAVALKRGWRKDRSVPVVYFEGTIEEAVLAAHLGNIQDKLPMTNQEKQDAAWGLVVTGRFTRPQIMEATGVSRTQVTNMRRTLEKLGNEEAEMTPSWWLARRKADNDEAEPMNEKDVEEMNREMAERWVDVLGKGLGKKPQQHLDAWIMAQEDYLGRRFEEMVIMAATQLGEEAREQLLKELSEPENPDF